MSLYDILLTTIDGKALTLDAYRGQTLLIVNVASRCGYTPQYADLEALYLRYKEKGFTVLGFPCNQFARQEPEDEEAIKRFCDTNYGITFPLFSKVEVNGPNAHPLFQHLKAAKKGWLGRQAIAWNFTKFLVSREGEVLKRYGSRDTPETIEKDLIRLLILPGGG
jgi:glutathione peroxidase